MVCPHPYFIRLCPREISSSRQRYSQCLLHGPNCQWCSSVLIRSARQRLCERHEIRLSTWKDCRRTQTIQFSEDLASQGREQPLSINPMATNPTCQSFRSTKFSFPMNNMANHCLYFKLYLLPRFVNKALSSDINHVPISVQILITACLNCSYEKRLSCLV